ncbi:hypothetical protein [Jiella avicenniae]|uniref:Uncharacterized protein n=1 Tax=Jiella avicenniae TaxID=2907202 RepID=A0A9X1NX55_9HYPH|nr:hypothetical protein [Jiella avicenniae]MCE7026390.1 hypothetical protein [Jiella avicenniae]
MTRTVIETLGDLRDHRMSLAFFCTGSKCGRELGLTLDRAIEIYGADQIYIDWTPSRPAIFCRECGCRRMRMIVQAVPSGYGLRDFD